MSEIHTCTRCGAQGPPREMQAHVQKQHAGGPNPYGAPTVNVGRTKPASTLKPGARVSWQHSDGNTYTGTVWAEAPNLTSGGRAAAHRHVIPDGWQDTIPLPAKKLTEISSPLDASRNGEFHTAAAQMPGQQELGFSHQMRAAKAAGTYPQLAR